MPDARYYRDQAAICLEIARHMSDRQTVERLRATAAQHLARADDLDGAGDADAPAQEPHGARRREP